MGIPQLITMLIQPLQDTVALKLSLLIQPSCFNDKLCAHTAYAHTGAPDLGHPKGYFNIPNDRLEIFAEHFNI